MKIAIVSCALLFVFCFAAGEAKAQLASDAPAPPAKPAAADTPPDRPAAGKPKLASDSATPTDAAVVRPSSAAKLAASGPVVTASSVPASPSRTSSEKESAEVVNPAETPAVPEQAPKVDNAGKSGAGEVKKQKKKPQ